MASMRRRSGAKITANNSLQRTLPAINLPGIEVRNDGDVVRIELPARAAISARRNHVAAGRRFAA